MLRWPWMIRLSRIPPPLPASLNNRRVSRCSAFFFFFSFSIPCIELWYSFFNHARKLARFTAAPALKPPRQLSNLIQASPFTLPLSLFVLESVLVFTASNSTRIVVSLNHEGDGWGGGGEGEGALTTFLRLNFTIFKVRNNNNTVHELPFFFPYIRDRSREIFPFFFDRDSY